jgi:mRNA interferase RelE/StbE
MYHVGFTPDGDSDLAHLDTAMAQRVFKKLRWLAENFDAIRPEALTGQWGGMYKLTIGDHRVQYTFDKTAHKIVVHFVKHRREVYKMR